ncbi:MAG: tRNA preQ1(34) S-adenosylmethionine ribosyltransferase-isomerase QueA [Defluviitaleaceae bacterium]|nr:tRNA preQ1(34) S-adenosylmethionine ribosyltransferase-isomerase QueA [Defluviitaleaceae bacterium]
MNKKNFFYELPKNLIAQQPIAQRDGSRMMKLNRATGEISHKKFADIVNLFDAGDCIVINDSKVIPARLFGKTENGGAIEMLLHQRLGAHEWTVLVKPARKATPGKKFFFGEKLIARIEKIIDDGLRIVSFEHNGDFETILEEIGEMPLPHYIEEKQTDASRYNTVYAKNDGSVAAPTAGLHFTNEILEQIVERGIKIARVTLHVGIGTFRPVKADDITKHHMHSEFCRIEPVAADLINSAKKNGKRVIAIGTTSCRTIESRADENGFVRSGAGKTDIFIFPGYEFKIIDGLLTNFHLPESTLIMLVSAFAGREKILAAYEEAVRERYRFFSYGDAMLIF